MDAYEAIITKRDTRSYTNEPIAEDVLRRVLQAGRMAGSSKNRQPFRFVVVRDKSHMAELAKCGDFSEPLDTELQCVLVYRNDLERVMALCVEIGIPAVPALQAAQEAGQD